MADAQGCIRLLLRGDQTVAAARAGADWRERETGDCRDCGIVVGILGIEPTESIPAARETGLRIRTKLRARPVKLDSGARRRADFPNRGNRSPGVRRGMEASPFRQRFG